MNRGSPVRKLPARKLLGAIVAAALFLPETAYTLGLGEIEVSSALNQKLNANIELLSATPEDTETLIVKLASRKEFSRAGLDRPYLLNDLRFKSEVIDGVPHIRVTSSSPIREPFLNFLVEIDWPNGHLLREYTVLLDPPVFMTQVASPAATTQGGTSASAGFRPSSSGSTNVVPVVTPGVVASPRPAAGSVAPAPQVQPQAVAQTYVPAPYLQQQATINQPPGSYRIQSGDTAWSLANAMMPDQSITVEQMMIAMLRSNPESFIGENINGLKRGYILRVPDYNEIVSINPQDARALVREQAALWRQYQQTQAGGQPSSAMPADEMGGSSVVSDDDTGVSGEEDAYLEIVSAGSGTSTMSGKDPTEMTAQELRAELAFARERVETERVEKEALQQRIDSLEQNLSDMKGLLSIEDDALSDIQALGQPAGSQTQGEMLEPDMVEGAVAEMDESIAETDDMLAEQRLDDAISEETEIADSDMATTEDGVETEEGESAVFLDETSADAESAEELAESAEPMQEEVVAEDSITPQPQIVSQPPADPLSKLLSDPILLAAAGGGLLLILAIIGLIIKKRREAAEDNEAPLAMDMNADDLESVADDIAAEETAEAEVESLSAGQMAEPDTAEEFDSDSTMILDSSVEDTIISEDSGSELADEDEPRDDVIAEADVYLAYGIYQQAEELLTQAIADNPDRDDYRVKLAETHYASKNADAFIEVASEIKKRAGDEDTPAWKKVMVMGQDLCADNQMFQGSMVGGLDVDSLAPKAPEMDFDLGLDAVEETGEASSDLDLSLDDQPLELPEMEQAEEESEEDLMIAEPVAEIEFDLSDTGAVEEAPAEDEFSLDIDASELDIDILEEAEEPVVSEDDEIHDVGDIDIDFGLEDETPAAEDEEDEDVAIDLTDEADSLDLDLDDAFGEESTATAVPEEPAVEVPTTKEPATEEPIAELDEVAASSAMDEMSDEDDFDLSSLDDVDEVSTKLDLARAYLDMGDHEGTRGILEEVIAEGDDEQKQEASELMAKLD
jgi:pilus assembly protein FimV